MSMLTCTTCDGLTPIGSSATCLHCDTPLRRPPRWVLRLTALLGPAGAILLAACYGAPGRYHTVRPDGPHGMTRVDRDGDGNLGAYTCEQASSQAECNAELGNTPPAPDADCDDNDRARYHGAADTQGDGIDQNCDGVDGGRDPNVVAEPPTPATAPLPPSPQ
jgi:hypothetical protein